MNSAETYSKDKVSIIIPTYNQVNYIEQAVQSALNQDYSNLEVIISDDNSTDLTEEKIKPLLEKNKNLKYFKNTQNLGRVKNYHTALYKYASGDFALNLDGDDYLIDNSYISKAIKLFHKDEKIVLVFALKKTFIQSENIFIEDKFKPEFKEINSGNQLFLNYTKGHHIAHLSSLYKRKLAIQSGYYLEDIQSSDWESVLRLILNKKVGFINTHVGVWRKHDKNASKTINVKAIINNTRFIENAYKKAVHLKIDKQTILSEWRTKMLVRMFLNFIIKSLYLSKNQTEILLSEIKKYDKTIYFRIKRDLKYKFFRLIYKQKKVVLFIFKHILKKESFVRDLLYNAPLIFYLATMK